MEASLNVLLPETVPSEDDFFALRAEKAQYAMVSAQAGYAQTTSVGLTVQKGTYGTLDYKIRMKAVSSTKINKLDAEFQASLTAKEKREFELMKKKYQGGLNIPCLCWLGADLSWNVDKKAMEKAAEKRIEYNEKVSIVEKALRTCTKSKIEVSGSLQACGVSFIPTTVEAFIKVAQVKLIDGSVLCVVSNNKDDTCSATTDGKVVPSDDKELNIIEL